MKTTFVIFVLSICSFLTIHGQTGEKLDSLWIAYKQAKHDTTRIQIINEEIGPLYENDSPDSAIIYYEMAVEIADKALPEKIPSENLETNSLNYKLYTLKATSLYNIGFVHNNQSRYDMAVEYYIDALNIFKEIKIKKGMADCYRVIGIVHNDQGRYDKALENYLEALQIFEELEDKMGMARCYNDIGIVHYDQGIYDKTVEYFLKSLEIKEEMGDKEGMSACYINIGIIHNYQGHYDEAVEYQLKALKVYEEIQDKEGMSACYTNIGVTHADQGNYDEAIAYYLRALEIDKELQDKRGIIILHSNIANLYISLADSLAVHDPGNYPKRRRTEYLDSAVYYGTQAYELAREIETASLVYMASGFLQKAYKSKGNYKKALDFAEILMETKDTIISEEKMRALSELQTKYETEKKERQIELQETQLMAKDAKIKQQKTFRNALLGGLGAVIIIIVLIVYAYLQKRKANKKITEQNEQILEVNKELKKLNNEIVIQKDEIESQRDELEQTLENLKRTQFQLIQSEKLASLGGLVAGVAHEINTPVGIGVTAVSSLMEDTKKMADLYKKEQISRKDFKEFLQTTNNSARLIQKNLERTAQLVQSFKQVSADQSTEEQREFLFKAYLEDVIRSLYPKFKNRNIEIRIDCDGKLKVDSYPGIFAQIFTNLVLNSITHGFPGDREGIIDIIVKQEDNSLTIEYKDNGKGIPEDILPRIFDPFFTTDQAKGTGLGLNIVYNLVTQKLKGSISCASEMDKGVEFKMVLPVGGNE